MALSLNEGSRGLFMDRPTASRHRSEADPDFHNYAFLEDRRA